LPGIDVGHELKPTEEMLWEEPEACWGRPIAASCQVSTSCSTELAKAAAAPTEAAPKALAQQGARAVPTKLGHAQAAKYSHTSPCMCRLATGRGGQQWKLAGGPPHPLCLGPHPTCNALPVPEGLSIQTSATYVEAYRWQADMAATSGTHPCSISSGTSACVSFLSTGLFFPFCSRNDPWGASPIACMTSALPQPCIWP